MPRGASGSSQIRASVRIPAGRSRQISGGERSSPSHACRDGIEPPCANAGLSIRKVTWSLLGLGGSRRRKGGGDAHLAPAPLLLVPVFQGAFAIDRGCRRAPVVLAFGRPLRERSREPSLHPPYAGLYGRRGERKGPRRTDGPVQANRNAGGFGARSSGNRLPCVGTGRSGVVRGWESPPRRSRRCPHPGRPGCPSPGCETPSPVPSPPP